MKRFLNFLFFTAVVSLLAHAVNIPQGKFYFDNSLTRYSQVKFVYGDANNYTRIISMTNEGNNRWSVTIDQTERNMYRYSFAETSLDDGTLNQSFSTTKDYISNTLNEKRTATTDAAITVGWVYTPSSGDNWASGSWVSPNAAQGYSGTIPVIFITTENGAEITSKEEYLNGTYYIDAMGVEGLDNVGSADAPLPLLIKGRGNYTWTGFDKKPYRLKLDKKANLLGMSKSKHWGLLAHADDEMSWLRNTMGFSMSRRLGMEWTPSQQPVELVLNGKYWGLYMLTELIKIDKERVNITEQDDNDPDEYNATGGWLVEIDNYMEDEQVRIKEGNGKDIWFTHKSPEILSDAQRNFLTNLVTNADKAIYANNKNDNSWENYIDIDELVKFYLVQEILDNAESFHGSCYWHKERGEDTKMIFGPVWDFGNTFRRNINGQFIYQNPPYGQTWIGEIAKFPHFQEVMTARWKEFLAYDLAGYDEEIASFGNYIAAAAQCDAVRWPQYNHANVQWAEQNMLNSINTRLDWLKQQWGTPDMTTLRYDVNRDGLVNGGDITALYNCLLNDVPALGNSDINDDGITNGSDITALYQYLLGEGSDGGGGGGGTTDDDDNFVTIFVKADVAPHLYVWTVDQWGNATYRNGDWPGEVLTEQVTDNNGTTWWKARFDFDTVNIIFNNGYSGTDNQTDNIEGLTRGKHYYSYSGGHDYSVVTPGDDDDDTPDDPRPSGNIRIFVQADAAPHLYAWSEGERGNVTVQHGDWPGDEMTDTVTINGTTWWTAEFDLDTLNIIFNNGGYGPGNQTEDIRDLARGDYYFTYDGGDRYELLNTAE